MSQREHVQPSRAQQVNYTEQPFDPRQPVRGPGPWRGPAGLGTTDVVAQRVGQYILDAAVAIIPVVVTMLVLGAVATAIGGVGGAVLGSLVALLYIVGLLAAPWYVMVYWPATHRGRTPAMGWLGLRIVDQDSGDVPTLGALTLRWLLLVVDGFFAGLVGLVVISTHARYQRLGDQVAKTLVVRD